MAKAYAQNGRFDEVDSIFKIVEKRKILEFWIFIFQHYWQTNLEYQLCKRDCKSANADFPAAEFPEIELTSKYVFLGTDRVNKAIDKDFLAQKAFRNQNYAEAAKHFWGIRA